MSVESVNQNEPLDVYKTFYDGYVSGKITLDWWTEETKKCLKTVQELNAGTDPKTPTENLQRVSQMQVTAIAAKQAYYSNTLIGKISQTFQALFKKLFNTQTSIEKARDVIKQCDRQFDLMALKELLQNYDLSGIPPEHLPVNPFESNDLSCTLLRTSFPDGKQSIVATFEEIYNEKNELKAIPENCFLFTPKKRLYLISRKELLPLSFSRCVYKAWGCIENREVALVTSIPPVDLPGFTADYLQMLTNEFKEESEIFRKYKEIPQCLQLIDFTLFKFGPYEAAFAITPFYKKGTVKTFIASNENLTYEQKKSLISSIAQSLKEMHSFNYICRALRPETLLISDDSKVILNGLSQICRADDIEGKRQDNCNVFYMAPEYVKWVHVDKADSQQQIGAETDIWQLGVTCYYILFREEFLKKSLDIIDGEQKSRSIKKIVGIEEKDVNKAFEEKVGPLEDLTKRMLSIEPEKRPTIDQVIDELDRLSESGS